MIQSESEQLDRIAGFGPYPQVKQPHGGEGISFKLGVSCAGKELHSSIRKWMPCPKICLFEVPKCDVSEFVEKNEKDLYKTALGSKLTVEECWKRHSGGHNAV